MKFVSKNSKWVELALYLLDTNVLINVLRGKSEAIHFLERALDSENILACCAITVAEVRAGLRIGEEAATSDFLRSLKFVECSRSASELAGDMKNHWRSKGRTIEMADALIAAIAVSNHCVLITGNLKDFPMSGLEVRSI